MDQQFGLSKFTYENYAFIKSEAAVTESSNVPLGFLQLKRMFWWLSAGLFMSLLVFIIELVNFKRKKKHRIML